MQRKPPPKNRARKGVCAVVGKSGQLGQIDGLIRNEAIGQRKLNGRAISIAPFSLGNQGHHLGNLIATDCAARACAIDQDGLPIFVTPKS